jgi:multiple sugar transport system substrate-binding protein
VKRVGSFSHAFQARYFTRLTARIFVFVLLPVSLGSWCSCTRSPDSLPRTRTLNIALAVFPEEADHYRKFTEEFERTSGIQLKIVAQTYTDILKALEAEATAGSGTLDLIELDLAMLAEGRASVRQLNSIVSPSARELFPKAAWEVGEQNGAIYFVPHRLMWEAMVYNKEQVPSPPRNWAELLNFGREHPGKLALKAALYEGTICDALPFIWGAGGDLTAPESPGSIAGLELIGRLAPYANNYSAVFREMSVLEAQARGEVWIHFNWPFAMSYLKGKGLAPDPNRSAPIPAGPRGTATTLGGGYLGIPTSAPHRDSAEQFLRYLLTTQAQQKLSEDLGWYGSVSQPKDSTEAQLYEGYTAMKQYVRTRPTITEYAELSNQWQRAIRGVLFDHQSARSAVAKVRCCEPEGR